MIEKHFFYPRSNFWIDIVMVSKSIKYYTLDDVYISHCIGNEDEIFYHFIPKPFKYN